MDLNQIIAWLNDTMVKTVLLFVGGFILKKWEPFVNKAIPVMALLASAFISTLQTMFPSVVPPPGTTPAMYEPASFVATTFAGVPFYAVNTAAAKGASWVWNTLVPIAFAIGTQSGSKNTIEWFKMGLKLFVKK